MAAKNKKPAPPVKGKPGALPPFLAAKLGATPPPAPPPMPPITGGAASPPNSPIPPVGGSQAGMGGRLRMPLPPIPTPKRKGK